MFTELLRCLWAGKRWHGKIKMHGGTKKRATDPCHYPAGVCGDAELGGNADAGHALSTLTSTTFEEKAVLGNQFEAL